MSHVFLEGDWVPVAQLVRERDEARVEVERLRTVIESVGIVARDDLERCRRHIEAAGRSASDWDTLAWQAAAARDRAVLALIEPQGGQR